MVRSVLLLALAAVSYGNVIDSLKPGLPNEDLSPDEMAKLMDLKRKHLQEIKMQYEQAQTNFNEFRNSDPAELKKLRSEVGQLEAAMEQATATNNKLLDDDKRMRQRIDLFVQVATDEKKMYSNKLTVCTTTGHSPKSFVTSPPRNEARYDKNLVPGVRQGEQKRKGQAPAQRRQRGTAEGSIAGVHTTKSMPNFMKRWATATTAKPTTAKPTTAKPKTTPARKTAPRRALKRSTTKPATTQAPPSTLRPSLAAGVWKDPHNQPRATTTQARVRARRDRVAATTQASTPCPTTPEDIVALEAKLKSLMLDHEAWENKFKQINTDVAALEKKKGQQDQEKLELLEKKLQLEQPESAAAGEQADSEEEAE